MLALPAMPLLLQSCEWGDVSFDFPINVHSDRNRGHAIFKQKNLPVKDTIQVETLIVGGGIAGLSAANHLPHKDFLLCELSDRLGGTSAATNHKDLPLSQGAHYDLEYPQNYGESVLGLLDHLGIIEQMTWKSSWGFKDQQYIIPHEIKNQCYDHGKFRGDVLREGEMKSAFQQLLLPYLDKMVMPTRLIEDKYKHLNDQTFIDFLHQNMKVDDQFIRGLDYHMLDDWGGLSSQVSALAGIHYFQCRPYYREVNQLFSPPQGNDYFVSKLASQVPSEQLQVNSLVRSLEKKEGSWNAEVLDLQSSSISKIKAKNVIYAGQKHALKYILPQYYPLFSENDYAPWLVMNFVLNKPFGEFGFWQNEMIVEDISFLGFINSSAQHRGLQEKQVLTAYYCLPSDSRKDLASISMNKNTIVQKTLNYLKGYFNQGIENRVEAVYLNAMGHAMPIPKPGFLFQDKNEQVKNEQLAFAGVDHHRLPLLFEAIDSGIAAVEAIYRTSKVK